MFCVLISRFVCWHRHCFSLNGLAPDIAVHLLHKVRTQLLNKCLDEMNSPSRCRSVELFFCLYLSSCFQLSVRLSPVASSPVSSLFHFLCSLFFLFSPLLSLFSPLSSPFSFIFPLLPFLPPLFPLFFVSSPYFCLFSLISRLSPLFSFVSCLPIFSRLSLLPPLSVKCVIMGMTKLLQGKFCVLVHVRTQV